MRIKKRTYVRNGVERSVWRARFWTYPPHGARRELVKEFPTRAEAVAWERDQAKSSRSRNFSAEKTRISDAGLWERAEPILRDCLASKTLDTYTRSWAKHVLPTIGSVRLGDLNSGSVERIQATWASNGIGQSTILQARAAMSAVFGIAVKDGLIPANPVRDATRPFASDRLGVSRKVGKILMPSQLQELVGSVRMTAGDPYATIADLMGSIGLRYGECAARCCGDLDFDRKIIHVRRTAVEVTVDDGPPVSSSRKRVGNLVWGPPKGGRDHFAPLPAISSDISRPSPPTIPQIS